MYLFFQYPQILFGQPPSQEKETVMKGKLSILENILSHQPYIAGDHLTVADLSIVNTLSLLQVCDYSLASYPHLDKWVHKVKSEFPQYEETAKNGIKIQADYLKSHSK